jgi:phosphatidylserine decarboxylase
VRDLSIATWRLFCDVDLSDARKSSFASMRDCFTRELKEGARPIDADASALVSPCDAIVGAAGTVADDVLLQVKGSPYSLDELLCDPALASLYRNGRYATLRLTAGMYHRFHAPHDCRVTQVTHIAGDAWNVNPSALKRVDKLYCRNERAVLRLDLGGGQIVTLVAIAAILVADVRLRFLDIPVTDRERDWTAGPLDVRLAKGEEMGWFEQGSTIIALAPDCFSLCDKIQPGHRIRMGEPLLLRP